MTVLILELLFGHVNLKVPNKITSVFQHLHHRSSNRIEIPSNFSKIAHPQF
jgi:hypothetical protein